MRFSIFPKTNLEKLTEFARQAVIGRYSNGTHLSHGDQSLNVLCDLPLCSSSKQTALRLQQRFGFPLQILPCAIPLANVLVIFRSEVPPELQPAWNALRLTDRFEPFAYDLLEAFEKHCDHRSVAKSLLERGLVVPKGDDSWIDWLQRKSLVEYFDMLNKFPIK